MKKKNISKLLPTVTVFAFVAFCFAIAHSFGNTYAYTAADCPSGWNYSEPDTCTKIIGGYDENGAWEGAANMEECEAEISNLGLEINDVNYCLVASNAALYGYISVEEYLEAVRTYTVTYDAGEGYVSRYTDTCTTATTGGICYITNPPTPTRSEYTFNGWSFTEDCPNNDGHTGTLTLSASRTVYACYEKKNTYTITFDINGGTMPSGSSTTVSVAEGEKITMPTPTKTGYVFKYWRDTTRGIQYTGGQEVTVTSSLGSMNLVAYYVKAYTITFDVDGGTMPSGSSTTMTVEENKIIKMPTPTKTGYVFKYWRDTTRGIQYTGGQEVTVTSSLGSMNLVAVYDVDNSTDDDDSGNETPTTYSVTFKGLLADHLQNAVLLNKNGTVLSNHTVSGLTSSSFNVSNYSASSDNYEFTHWSYGECDNENSTLTGTITLNSESTDIYACWKAKETTDNTQKDVNIIANAGEGYISYVEGKDNLEANLKTYTQTCFVYNDTSKCGVGGEVKAEREGYLFNGWGTSKECTSGTSITEYKASKETTYYACWTKSVTFKGLLADHLENAVLLNKNGAILSNHTISGLTETTFNVSDYSASSDNYEFSHWSYGQCDNENSTLTGEITLNSATTDIYACWTNKEPVKFNVTFNLNKGALYVDGNKTTITNYVLSEIDLSKYTAKLDDHTFIGWRTSNQTCNDAVKTGTKKVTEATTLYACYKKIENPQTGSSMLYIAYLIGILALGYTIYYSYKVIKAKK